MDMFTKNNKVNFEFIESELEKVRFDFAHVEGTTTTVVTALDADGYQLAVGTSGCVDPNNFDEVIGEKVAYENAKAAAKDKLWELYGFLLHKKIREEIDC